MSVFPWPWYVECYGIDGEVLYRYGPTSMAEALALIDGMEGDFMLDNDEVADLCAVGCDPGDTPEALPISEFYIYDLNGVRIFD